MCVINVVARTRALRARNIHIHLQPAMWIFFLIIFIFFPHSEFGRQYEVNANKNKGTKMRTTRNCVRPAVKKSCHIYNNKTLFSFYCCIHNRQTPCRLFCTISLSLAKYYACCCYYIGTHCLCVNNI